MYNFNKKQKIVLVILAIAVILGICYYVYAKDGDFSSMEELQVEESLQDNSEEVKETNKENEENIVVHISGAVEKEGIVELKVNSRVADQTTPNMIQRIIGIFERKPLISKEI